MNIVITLPRDLINKILSGEKLFEMRKSCPYRFRYGDGVFVIEKGTDIVRCFFEVDNIISMEPSKATAWAADLGVSVQYIANYCKNARRIYMWEIGGAIELSNYSRALMGLKQNPQNFAYTNIRLL